MTLDPNIIWPAIIKFEGDNELGFVADQMQWNEDVDLHAFAYAPMDVLVDSTGQLFGLDGRQHGKVFPQVLDEAVHLSNTVNLEQVTDWVRAHASELGHCCVSKLGFYSIAEAIRSVAEFDER